jgi:hypothetical protein
LGTIKSLVCKLPQGFPFGVSVLSVFFCFLPHILTLKTCGIIMVIAILVILSNFLGLIPDEVFKKYHLTFWMETIAVESFGVAWLTKAEVILKDK